MEVGPLIILGTAQFLMVLDSSVMNVAISTLVEDFDTTVTQIQAVITLYSLVMAALLLTGAKLGDIFGSRRILAIGMVIYASGSALTAVSWSVPSLTFGWSILEGIGAALVLLALVATNFEKEQRVDAYAIIGAMAGIGIAVGPILGGWVTTEMCWRVVFVGEVVLSLAILFSLGRLKKDEPVENRPSLDWVGSILSATGVGLVVYGILKATEWGWITPSNSPIEPLGLSLTPVMVAIGLIVLSAFWRWEQWLESQGKSTLVQTRLFSIPALRSGLETTLGQTLILASIFFTIPLYLQVVQGLDALDTGIRMLPVSIAMFITSIVGARLATRFSPRLLVRSGLGFLVLGVVVLLGTLEPDLDSFTFGLAMALLGVGIGLMVSQLANVVQSSVGEAEQSEGGGLLNTASQFGSALGVAFIGAITISILSSAFLADIAEDQRLPANLREEIALEIRGEVSFVPSAAVEAGATEAGLEIEEVQALVEGYEDSQIEALQTAVVAVAGVILLTFLMTGGLPSQVAGSAGQTALGRPEEIEPSKGSL